MVFLYPFLAGRNLLFVLRMVLGLSPIRFERSQDLRSRDYPPEKRPKDDATAANTRLLLHRRLLESVQMSVEAVRRY